MYRTTVVQLGSHRRSASWREARTSVSEALSLRQRVELENLARRHIGGFAGLSIDLRSHRLALSLCEPRDDADRVADELDRCLWELAMRHPTPVVA